MRQGLKFWELKRNFRISKRTASKTFDEIKMFLLANDEYIPRLWTANTPDDEVSEYLRGIRDRQSAGIRRLQDYLRGDDGREISLILADASRVYVQHSKDGHLQQNLFSGKRMKGHCILQTTLTCPAGCVVAIAPGKIPLINVLDPFFWGGQIWIQIIQIKLDILTNLLFFKFHLLILTNLLF